MTEAIPEFGERVVGLEYWRRPSAYAVVIDDAGRVLVCAVDGKLHLPGGGIEVGESPEEAVLREVREETGLLVSLDRHLGIARQWVSEHDGSRHYAKTAHFYAAVVGGGPGGSVEDDHGVVWAPVERAAAEFMQGFHAWAVARAVESPVEHAIEKRRLPSSRVRTDHG